MVSSSQFNPIYRLLQLQFAYVKPIALLISQSPLLLLQVFLVQAVNAALKVNLPKKEETLVNSYQIYKLLHS